MYGSVDAELELTAFLCFLKKVTGPTKVHVDNKEIIGGLWRGERKCIDPKAGDADLWIKMWEELQLSTLKEILVEVEHVKAHRTEKDKKEMSHFEKFVTDGNEAGAMLDESDDRIVQTFSVVTVFPGRRLAGPQWCQCWRLCFVFCVFCVASPRW